jgi:hypothetical protein
VEIRYQQDAGCVQRSFRSAAADHGHRSIGAIAIVMMAVPSQLVNYIEKADREGDERTSDRGGLASVGSLLAGSLMRSTTLLPSWWKGGMDGGPD